LTNLQDRVYVALLEMGCSVKSNCFDSGRFIPCVLANNGEKITIEVDWHTNFSADGTRVLGPTKFRNRTLKAYGWRVICLKHSDIPSDERGLMEFLKSQLEVVGAIPR